MLTRLILSTVIFAALAHSAQAEDWTTTNGKTYKHVRVIKVEDDAVTILDADGGALVPLEFLSPDLQKQFHYNPEKAKVAAAKRQSEDDASAKAVADQQKQDQALAAKAAADRQAALAKAAATPPPAAPKVVATTTTTTPAPSAPAPAPSTSSSSSSSSNSTPPSTAGGQFALNQGQASAEASVGHEGYNKDWKLVWSDEFDEDKIDTSKWGFEIDGKGGGNGEMEYYTDMPENAHLQDGHLIITAIKGGKDASGKTHAFTSARMTTKGKFNWKYGRFEARIKMPKGKGVWPAFWLMPQDSAYGGWASSGEIDIVEVIGDKANTSWGTIHYGDKWPKNVHTGDKLVLPSGDLSDDFHTYAVEWEAGVIRWYFDDKLYQTQTKWYTKAAPFPAPFDQNFFVILNFAVGGAWPGKPAADTVFPQTMDVDYVRVYQP